MQAVVTGDVPVDGTAFTCVSCHLRSGLGSVEGTVTTPPTNGKKLFQPIKQYLNGIELPPRRPAYTDESLAEVLRSGIDPSERRLKDVMPRYLLDDKDMAVLVSYLKLLSSQLSPGATETSIKFATVISDEVRPEDRDAMLIPLDDYVAGQNYLADLFANAPTDSRSVELGHVSQVSNPKLSLSHWVLKGSPETWRAQLEEYNRREPIFALLGGITTGEWKPIHEFCEANQIPCLFPVTDFPVISDKDWYTLYLSKGIYQEGEGAARYLGGMEKLLKGKSVVQFVRNSRESQTLMAGFQDTWRDLGQEPPVTVTLNKGETLTKGLLQQVLDKNKPAAVMLWVDSEALPVLDMLAASKDRPEMVFVSSGYFGKKIWTLKEEVCNFTYITYPYRLPQEKPVYSGDIHVTINMKNRDDAQQLIFKRAYSVLPLLDQVLAYMKGKYYRDYFLDVTGMMVDQEAPAYKRLSYGPGQRYAAKGCYVVQLRIPKPEFVMKGDWVIH